MKGSGTIILAVVLLLPPAPCCGDAVFRCECESTLFGLPKEDTTRNQWLSCIYYTVPEQFHPNISVQHIIPEPGRVACNAGLHKGCFNEVGQFQLCKDSLALLTHFCKYVFVKSLPLTIQMQVLSCVE